MNIARLFENSPDIVEYPVGGTIFERGDDAGGKMFVLLDGLVEIRIGDRTVETVEPGGFFGEMALIDEAPRSATAVAQVRSRLARVDEKQFIFMVQQTPFFSLHVMRVLVTRLRNLNRRLV